MTLLDLPTDELTSRARVVRAATTGTRVTYSPKVFIPLTMLCRDRCGYCTFAQPPARVAVAVPHARRRCSRIAAPGAERRLPRGAVHARRGARGALPGRPRSGSTSTATPRPSTTSRPCAALVLDETGLLPHANAGALCRRRARRAAAGRAEPGDDARVAQRRPRLPPRRARQDARAPAGHARGRRRAGHPVHHRDPRRHRRDRGRPHRRAARPSPPATAATATCRR